MHSRGRVGHRLVGLSLDGDGPLPDRAAPIEAGGKRAGEVTSVARSPRFGAIALGIVRVGFDAAGSEVRVAGRPARIVALPFGAHGP
jgi:aminomethyltransferase